jgi:hypothetical protein
LHIQPKGVVDIHVDLLKLQSEILRRNSEKRCVVSFDSAALPRTRAPRAADTVITSAVKDEGGECGAEGTDESSGENKVRERADKTQFLAFISAI